MKDALGHGSNSNRADFARNKIGIASGAKFNMASRPLAKQSTNDQVAGLRARLSAPKQGLLHSFASGIKSALDAGARLHANSFAPTSRN